MSTLTSTVSVTYRRTTVGRLSAPMLIAFSVLGLTASIVLLHTHWTSGAAGCTAGAGGCVDVITTRWGQLLGIPIPVFLVPFYLLMGGLGVLHQFGAEDWRGSIARFARLLAGCAVIVSVLMAICSLFIVKKICAMCALLYGVNILLVGFSLHLTGRDGASVRGLFAGRWVHYVIAPAGIVFLALFVVGERNLLALRGPLVEKAPQVDGSTLRPALVANTTDIVVLLSPTCPHCAEFYPVFRQALGVLVHLGLPVSVAVENYPANDPHCAQALGVTMPPQALSDVADKNTLETIVHAQCAAEFGKSVVWFDHMMVWTKKHPDEAPTTQVLVHDVGKKLGIPADWMAECTGITPDGTWVWEQWPKGKRQRVEAAVRRRFSELKWEVPQVWVNGTRMDLKGVQGSITADEIVGRIQKLARP